MSMTKRDFESIARTFKTQYEAILAEKKMMFEGTTDERVRSLAYTRYEASADSLGRLARGMVKAFSAANPLFREWTFYEACGMRKFYDRSNVDVAKELGKLGHADDSEFFEYAYIATAEYAFRDGRKA